MTSSLEAALDAKTGIVRTFRLVRPLQRHPRLWLGFAKACQPITLGALSAPQSGGGIGLTVTEARAAAIGEVIERYCGAFSPDLHVSSWKLLSARYHVLGPETFNSLHSDNAPDFTELTEEGNARWCRGWFADTGEETYAPWSLVCLGATRESRSSLDEGYPGPSISTGLACAASAAKAALRAILECCERDAAMLAWYSRRFRGRISPVLMAATWPVLTEETQRCGLTAHIIEVTTDLEVPSYISVVTPARSRERATFGMASGLTHEAAARKAFLESLHTWMWADMSVDQAEPITQANIGKEFPDFESRVVAFGSGVMKNELATFFDAVDSLPLIYRFDQRESRPMGLRGLATLLAGRGHPVLLFDMTTDDVRSIGFHVVRAICPTLQMMEGAHELRKPNRKRLCDALGTKEIAFDMAHPYP